MTVFDTDVLVEILDGIPAFVQRAADIPINMQAIPIVVAEEILRGRLHAVRQAEGGKLRLTISRAYELLAQSLIQLRGLRILPYNTSAHSIFQGWRDQKVRVATHDLRIAAICVERGATLISRNRRDFDQVPGLDVEYWD